MIADPSRPAVDAPAARSTPVIAVEPLAVDTDGAGRLVNASGRSWRRWHSAGLVPVPVRIGGSIRWDVSELRAWIAAGCPTRARWLDLRSRGALGGRRVG